MAVRTRQAWNWRIVAAAMVCAASTFVGGCYERITRAEGFGADRISTESPNRTQGPLDKLIFGDDQPSKNTVK